MCPLLLGTVKNNLLQWQAHFAKSDATSNNIAGGQLQSGCEVPPRLLRRCNPHCTIGCEVCKLGWSEDDMFNVILDVKYALEH